MKLDITRLISSTFFHPYHFQDVLSSSPLCCSDSMELGLVFELKQCLLLLKYTSHFGLQRVNIFN